eukprot:TRINITY_DN3086_c0_g7_i1.p1 TRINITY_DN3086_c0_g7~~TRINITY_DN3086_c0_g7_i1.p1  ORF type:complete len:627 (+),score=65.91 TRINITY_DN3086_c0_g7_i1:69-1949(+)
MVGAMFCIILAFIPGAIASAAHFSPPRTLILGPKFGNYHAPAIFSSPTVFVERADRLVNSRSTFWYGRENENASGADRYSGTYVVHFARSKKWILTPGIYFHIDDLGTTWGLGLAVGHVDLSDPQQWTLGGHVELGKMHDVHWSPVLTRAYLFHNETVKRFNSTISKLENDLFQAEDLRKTFEMKSIAHNQTIQRMSDKQETMRLQFLHVKRRHNATVARFATERDNLHKTLSNTWRDHNKTLHFLRIEHDIVVRSMTENISELQRQLSIAQKTLTAVGHRFDRLRRNQTITIERLLLELKTLRSKDASSSVCGSGLLLSSPVVSMEGFCLTDVGLIWASLTFVSCFLGYYICYRKPVELEKARRQEPRRIARMTHGEHVPVTTMGGVHQSSMRSEEVAVHQGSKRSELCPVYEFQDGSSFSTPVWVTLTVKGCCNLLKLSADGAWTKTTGKAKVSLFECLCSILDFTSKSSGRQTHNFELRSEHVDDINGETYHLPWYQAQLCLTLGVWTECMLFWLRVNECWKEMQDMCKTHYGRRQVPKLYFLVQPDVSPAQTSSSSAPSDSNKEGMEFYSPDGPGWQGRWETLVRSTFLHIGMPDRDSSTGDARSSSCPPASSWSRPETIGI